MLDLIIKSDRVVTPADVGEYEVGIKGERIVSVTIPGALNEPGRRVVDASGKIVVPGGIETHAHVAQKSRHDPNAIIQKSPGASRAAAFGGTTTILDFAVASPCDPLTAVADKQKEWSGQTYIDYSFHCNLVGSPPVSHLDQIPEVIAQGVTTIKCYTRGRPPLYTTPKQVEDGYLHEIMCTTARHGGVMAIHAENEGITTFMREKLKREGRTGVENIHLLYNNLSEDIEFRKVIMLAERAGAAVYFVHISAKEGVSAVAEARSKGLPIYGETLHNYMAFSCENYKEPDGAKYHTYPSVKFPEDGAALWAGVMNGTISTLGTDDVTGPYSLKVSGKTIFDCAGGHNGIETRLPYMFSEGVSKRGMSLRRFVDVASANAARILGMYPKKGAIAPGSDADIVVIDPSISKTLKLTDLHADSDYSIWVGWPFKGWPVMTVLRGKIIVENDRLLGSLTDGKFVARKTSPEILAGPAS
ncbi:MAG: amidohydrolase family protein [Chloroflexi bacterium]|nr:amidohydrolase family protein [Chloroflexota bacterium]